MALGIRPEKYSYIRAELLVQTEVLRRHPHDEVFFDASTDAKIEIIISLERRSEFTATRTQAISRLAQVTACV
jgi:hypothetical protein